MKSEIKDAFQKVAAGFEARLDEEQKALEKRLSDRQQFEAGWRDVRDRIVIPALKQIREEILTPAGWTSAVRTDDKEVSVTLEVHKGEMRALGSTRMPSVTFASDKYSPTVFSVAQSISQGGGQGGKVALGEVTEEFVQTKVLMLFERLASGG